MIYNIPIESLQERYSSQWNEWFPREFALQGVKSKAIYPTPLTDSITAGAFLDVSATNYFKSMQMGMICLKIFKGRIEDRDVFFFHDLWFPGLEALAYMRQGLGLKFKIYGVLHAGSYDDNDFLTRKGMGSWAKHIENGWFDFVDGIFVATNYHKYLLTSKREVDEMKVHVTGLPIYPEFVLHHPLRKKRNYIIFPHRRDEEKNPGAFDLLETNCRFDNWEFKYTAFCCKDKGEYYDLLSDSSVAISTAFQETWGIAMQEAVMCGCIPLVPDRLSYMEMYPKEFKYQDLVDCEVKLKKIVKDKSYRNECERLRVEAAERFCQAGEKAIGNMLEIMKEGEWK